MPLISETDIFFKVSKHALISGGNFSQLYPVRLNPKICLIITLSKDFIDYNCFVVSANCYSNRSIASNILLGVYYNRFIHINPRKFIHSRGLANGITSTSTDITHYSEFCFL